MTHQLLNDTLDKVGKVRLAGLSRVPKVLAKLGNSLGIRLRLKVEPLLLKHHPEFLVVRDNAIVHDNKLVLGVRSVRVAVDRRWLSVCGPSCVRHADVRAESLVKVDGRLGNVRTERSDLADLLEEEHILLCIAIDRNTCDGGSASVELTEGSLGLRSDQPTCTVISSVF